MGNNQIVAQGRLLGLFKHAKAAFLEGDFEAAFSHYSWAMVYAKGNGCPMEYRLAFAHVKYALMAQGRPWDAWRIFGQDADVANGPPNIWLGERDLVGKFVAVETCPLSGLGDNIFAARYVPLLRDLGAERVAVVCHEPLRRLFLSLRGITSVRTEGNFSDHERGAYDYIVPLLTLPGHLYNLLPTHGPYLSAHPSDVEAWRGRLPGKPFRIGLVWRSSHADPERDFSSIEALRPLWSIPGVQAYSLVRRDLCEESEVIEPMIDLGNEIGSLADTAAIMANMDLIVTVDTGPAHLAGALGRPVWVVLKAKNHSYYWWRKLGYYPHACTIVAEPGDDEKSGPVHKMAELLSDLLLNSGRRFFLVAAG